jgi:hypothetical protein
MTSIIVFAAIWLISAYLLGRRWARSKVKNMRVYPEDSHIMDEERIKRRNEYAQRGWCLVGFFQICFVFVIIMIIILLLTLPKYLGG